MISACCKYCSNLIFICIVLIPSLVFIVNILTINHSNETDVLSITTNAALGLLVGLMIGCIVGMFIYYFYDMYKSTRPLPEVPPAANVVLPV